LLQFHLIFYWWWEREVSLKEDWRSGGGEKGKRKRKGEAWGREGEGEGDGRKRRTEEGRGEGEALREGRKWRFKRRGEGKRGGGERAREEEERGAREEEEERAREEERGRSRSYIQSLLAFQSVIQNQRKCSFRCDPPNVGNLLLVLDLGSGLDEPAHGEFFGQGSRV